MPISTALVALPKNSMISPIRVLLALVLQSLMATAAPVGICLHGYSPEAPAEKIECFEFEKVERTAADYRFFPQSDKSVMVTAYRFRGTIPYKPELAPTHPEFDKLLKLYEETARATPSTRPYLNPKILAMRGQAAEVAKQIENVAKLPTITMADGTQLIGCTMSKIENGFAIIRHQDGISKVSLKELDATEKKALNSTAEGWSLEDPSAASKDSTGTFAKIVLKNGVLLKKAKFKEVADGNLVFMADGKSVSVPADQFPGGLSVLGEEVVKSLAPVKQEASPEPSVASSGGHDSPTPAVQTKRANDAFGGGFVLPDMGRPQAEEPIPEKVVEKKSLPSPSKSDEIVETKREAEQGMQEAVDLAERYIIGEGVIQNLPEAVRLLKTTANKGYADAQFHLGSCYTFGRGVAQDEVAAASWFQKAADQGHAEAQFNLASCYYQGTGVAPDKKKWIEWLEKSADGGCAEAQGAMGVAHTEGIGVQKDEARAVEYFQKASEQNYAKAQYELGTCYDDGKGVPEDKAKARKYYILSAEGGYAKAQSYVGAMYHHGWGVPKDLAKGTEWYMLAARQGVSNDQCTIGNCYARGVGVEQSDTKAFEWYNKAAEQGDKHGQHYVGLCYKEGRGVPGNRAMAMKYFQSAAEQGNSDAKAEMLVSQKAGKGKNWNPMVIVAVGLMLVLAIAKVAFIVMKRSGRGGGTITKPLQNSKVSCQGKPNLKYKKVPQENWIKFTCSDCGTHISKERQFGGEFIECDMCGKVLAVPTAILDGADNMQQPAGPPQSCILPPVPGRQKATHQAVNHATARMGHSAPHMGTMESALPLATPKENSVTASNSIRRNLLDIQDRVMDSQVPRQAFESIQKKVSDLRGRAAASTLPMDALEFARKKIVDIQERAIASHLAEPALPTLEFSEPTLGDSLATEQQVNHFDPPITPENDAETQSDFADMTVDAATGGAGGSLSKSDLAVVSKSTSSLEIWGNSRLLPLLFCVIGLGWILPRILPVRFFTGDGVQIFLGILAIPLFLWSFLILVRPSKKILTKQFLSTGVVACLFTWVIGITLLVALQKIGQNQLDDFKFIPGKAALFSVASWVIGWLYQGAFHPEAAGMLQRILGWIFGVGLCEEFIKIIPVLLFFRLMRKESTASDQEAFPLLKEMVMIGIFSGIGFGIGEALRCYAPSSGNYGYGSLVTRWFALISSHAIWTGIVAQILWMIRDDLKGGSAKKIILIGLGASMSSGLMHGIYDLICGQWLLAVIANAVGILLFYHLINRCEEPSAFAISTMPQPILDLESWLWRKPTRKFGIAAAFVFIIYGIGSFGLSYDEARIQVELSPAQQSGGDYQSNEADRRLFKEFEDVYSVTEILGKRNGLNALEIVMASINGMNWNGASPDLLRSLNEMRSIRSGESPDSRGKKMEKFIYINSKY